MAGNDNRILLSHLTQCIAWIALCSLGRSLSYYPGAHTENEPVHVPVVQRGCSVHSPRSAQLRVRTAQVAHPRHQHVPCVHSKIFGEQPGTQGQGKIFVDPELMLGGTASRSECGDYANAILVSPAVVPDANREFRATTMSAMSWVTHVDRVCAGEDLGHRMLKLCSQEPIILHRVETGVNPPRLAWLQELVDFLR